MSTASTDFIRGLPKAELHLHIEGTLSLATKKKLATRNRLDPGELTFQPLKISPGTSSQSLDIAQYKAFLHLYYEGLKVLQTAEDFYDLALEYYENCQANNVIYAEISFDPQAHTDRGVPFGVVVEGLNAARVEARTRLGIDSRLIMCINRDRPVDSAFKMMESARPFRELITGLGLDSVEEGHPPTKFKDVYDLARSEGYELTAHCDVDMINATEHIRECIEELHLTRIDHGINVLDDPALIEKALKNNVSFTACPTWRDGDPKPRRVDRIQKMRALGLRVSINTDDPGYFASRYMNHMIGEVVKCGEMGPDELVSYFRNAFDGAWMTHDERQAAVSRLDAYVASARTAA